LAEYRSYKDRNVSAAAKSLINVFRDLNPDALEKKFSLRTTRADRLEKD
jgi:hypothetical protein